MILAEELICRPASAYAEKQDVIYCSTTATNAAELAGMWAAWVTALATVGLVLGAVVAWRTAKKTLDQMKADSTAEARPYVHAWIVPSIGGRQAWDLLIKNTGRTSARNLRVTVSEWPPVDALTAELRKLFDAGHTLPPQSTLRTYWYLGPRDQDGSTGSTGFDIPANLTVQYQGLEEGEIYSDTFRLDATIVGMTPSGASGVNLKAGSSQTDKKLNEIVIALNNMRREISDS